MLQSYSRRKLSERKAYSPGNVNNAGVVQGASHARQSEIIHCLDFINTLC